MRREVCIYFTDGEYKDVIDCIREQIARDVRFLDSSLNEAMYPAAKDRIKRLDKIMKDLGEE